MRSFFLPTLAILLLPGIVFGGEEPQEPATPAAFDLEFGGEQLDREPPIVAGSGRIHVKWRDFELSIPDGGVVIWVDVKAYREFRTRLRQAPVEGGAVVPAAEEILGKVFLELYAEGDVTLRRDHEVIRASRLFYNFAANRAVILDAELSVATPEKTAIPSAPMLLRADRLHQVVADELIARNARLTTCNFGEPHYELAVSEIELTAVDEVYTFVSKGNVLRAGGIPLFWFPWLYASSDFGLEPIRGADIGSSSRFGQHVSLTLGGSIRFGEPGEERTWGRWEATPFFRSRRGPGISAGLRYGDVGYRGEILGLFQRDREDEDRVTRLPIPRKDRGRARIRHRQVLDRDFFGGRLTGIGEVSWISDRGFLREYEPSEDRQGKAQEMVGYLTWAADQHALSLTGRWRANEFETQTEYRPRAAYDLFNLPVFTGLFGTEADLLLSGEAEAAKLVRVFDRKLPDRGELTNRYQARAAVSLPGTLGPVRLSPEFGAGATGYEGGQDEDRLDLFTGIRASTDFWRLYPDSKSEFLLLDGLRHVIDVSAGYANRFAVTEPSRDLVVQDPADLLDELQAFDLRIRNRLQTKRAGGIVDWIDLELRGLYFPERLPARPAPFETREEWGLGMSSLLVPEEELLRTIEREGMGPIFLDLRAQLRPDLFLVGDAWYDFETNEWETYSGGLRYEAPPDLAFYVGHRAIEGDASVLTTWVDLKLTPTWGARLLQEVNLRGGGRDLTGLVLRRYFHDFVFSLTLRRNQQERDTAVSISIEPRMLFEFRRRRTTEDVLDFEGMRWVR